MNKIARLARRLRQRLWHTAQDDRDLDDEIAFHLRQEEELRAGRGLANPDARIAARRDFGNIAAVKEVTRDMTGWHSLETLVRDLTFGVRLLRRSKGFAFFSIVTLALGIGATSAIFTLFNAIVLRPLPVRDPDRLIALSFVAGGSRQNNFLTYPLFDRLRAANTTLDGIFAWETRPRMSARVDGHNEIVSATFASGSYHDTLGLRAALGRLLAPTDDQPGHATSVVISYGYWQRRFSGDQAVIGKPVTFGDFTYTIVGVEPVGFLGTNLGRAADFTFPLRASTDGSTAQPWNSPNWTWIEVMARLKAGTTHEQAAQELTSIFRSMGSGISAPSTAPPPTVFVETARGGGQSSIRRNYAQRLRLMLMMLAAVLLLSSLNLATLLLARGEARRDEIAMRLALGAGRGRLVRQLLTESALIAVVGGTLGLVLATWASQALLRVAMRDTAGIAIDLAPDARVLAFTIAAAALTCVFFGLLPALRATASVNAAWRHEVRSRRQRWLERTLVASQTAVSLVLLVFMALFVRSLQNLWARDPGYVRDNVALFATDAELAGRKGDDVRRTYLTLLDQLRALPGTTHAAVSTVAPVSTSSYFVGGVGRLGNKDFSGDRRIRVATNFLSPGYFATLGIPLVAGRDFDDRDDATSPKVVIISERLAAKFDGPAVGQSLESSSGVAEVIGVAKDNRYATVKDAPRDVLYIPMFQGRGSVGYGPTFVVRHRTDSASALHAIRTVVTAVDPALPVFRLNTLEGYTRESLSQERLMAATSSYVGMFALLLASIGLYGLISYTVTERRPEIGLRMALGSSPQRIQALVVRDGAGMVLAGLVVGLLSAWWLVRFARDQIVDLQPLDPLSFALATAVLLIVAAGAAWLPALRASRIDPITALRHE